MIDPKRREQLNAAARRFYHRNKEKCNKLSLEWAKNNPEKLKKLKKKANAKWYQKPEVKERQRILSKLKYQEKKALGWKQERDPEYNAEYYQKNKKYIYKKHRKWVEKNHKKVNSYATTYNNKISQELSDGYIKGNLKKCGFSVITPEIIEIRREVTKIRRLIKNK